MTSLLLFAAPPNADARELGESQTAVFETQNKYFELHIGMGYLLAINGNDAATVPAQRYLMVIAGACAALYIMPHLARLRIEQLTSQDISTRASKHLQTQTMPRC